VHARHRRCAQVIADGEEVSAGDDQQPVGAQSRIVEIVELRGICGRVGEVSLGQDALDRGDVGA
jgi:hypothetical protein